MTSQTKQTNCTTNSQKSLNRFVLEVRRFSTKTSPTSTCARVRKEAGLEAKTPFEHAVFYSEFDFELAVPQVATTTKFYFPQGVYPDGNVIDFVVTQQENGGFIHLFQSYIDENVPGIYRTCILYFSGFKISPCFCSSAQM